MTGCARSSTSGARSAVWTARPTTRCGSGIRRPGKPSTAAAGRISPSWTASVPAPVRPRRRCANAPRNWPTPPTGAPPSAAFRDLLTEWKAAGRASKDVDDALWQRFKAAQDTFFTARNAVSAERDAEFRANAEAKEALLAEAEKLDTSDLDAARAALRTIGDKWDKIGKVPRERSADLERRLRAVEKKVGTRRRTASIRRLRLVPTNSGNAQSNSSAKRRRPPRRGEPRMPRRRGPTPSNGASGRRRRPRRSARRARSLLRPVGIGVAAGRRGSPAVLSSVAWRRPGGAPPRRRAAARCAPTPPGPS